MSTFSKKPNLKARHVPAGTDRQLTDEEAREKRVAARIRSGSVYSLETDKLAQNRLYYRNHPIPKGKELFPLEWKMQFSDLFYPNARDEKGQINPLYIDLPTSPHEVALCERKLGALKDLRYTYMKPGEGAWEGQLRLEGQDPDKIKADQDAARLEASLAREAQ